MPEIAEVETVRKTLKNNILNQRITDLKIIYPKMIVSNIEDFNQIINQKINDIKRIGKWLIFELDRHFLLSHLRMEGKYYIKENTEPISKHEHIIFTLDNLKELRYHDVRKFGQMILVKKEDFSKLKQINIQGIEANDPKLSVSYLKEKLRNKNLPIKSCLLDQTIISGLGNIYADEVLFASKIYPLTKGKKLNEIQLSNLINSSIKITNKAIEMGGTTIRSYTSSLGVNGKFQQELKVHKRENDLCFICQTKIIRIKVGGRSTYYCPICQKEE